MPLFSGHSLRPLSRPLPQATPPPQRPGTHCLHMSTRFSVKPPWLCPYVHDSANLVHTLLLRCTKSIPVASPSISLPCTIRNWTRKDCWFWTTSSRLPQVTRATSCKICLSTVAVSTLSTHNLGAKLTLLCLRVRSRLCHNSPMLTGTTWTFWVETKACLCVTANWAQTAVPSNSLPLLLSAQLGPRVSVHFPFH